MDLFYIVLFLGCLVGAAAFFVETHLHGIPQFAAIVLAVFTVAATGSVAFFGESMPHWVLMVAKIMTAIGFCTFAGYLAQHRYHGQKLHMGLTWVVGILAACAVVAYDPALGFVSPFPSSRAPVATNAPRTMRGAGQAPPSSVAPPPPASPPASSAPKRIKLGKVAEEDIPCYLRPSGCEE